jgi:uncharacterized protein (TIGR02147 family)
MLSAPTPLNLLAYSDYRAYLRDYYATRKTADANFSFRYLSARAGINSSAYFKYVMDGKRNLSQTTLLKTCQALGLKDKDAEYFQSLVFFNQAKTLKEKNLYFDKLTRLRGDYERRKVEEAQYAFYGEWHHSAVRELLECLRFKGDYPALAKRLLPAITPTQAEASVALLVRLGLAKKDSQGRWRQTDPVLTTGGQVEAEVVIGFQKRMLELALEAYELASPSERLMSSTTFGISEENFELFRKKIRDFKAELLELARMDKSPERVFQLNLNLFPLSRKSGK